MFENDLKTVLPSQSPRVVPCADYYMRTFVGKMAYAQTKASRTVNRNNGIRHLLLILKESRRFYQPGQSLSANQFTATVESIARSVSRVFDPTQSGITNRDFFVHSDAPYTEVLYLSDLVDPLSQLPEQIGYYQGWRDVKPLRMVEMSDMPLTLDVSNQQLTYNFAPAGFGVFALNPAALILKYESYRREFTLPNDTEDAVMMRYLVDTVIAPCLLRDSFALWMRNLYRNIFINNLPDYTYLDDYWPTESTQSVGAGYPNFLRDVENLRTDLINKNVQPGQVLWALPVSTDNTSLAQWMFTLMDTAKLPDQYQYHWIDGLAFFGWVETVWIALRLSGKSVIYRNFIRTIWHNLNQWILNHPWDVIHDPVIRSYIQNRAEGLMKLVEYDLKNM